MATLSLLAGKALTLLKAQAAKLNLASALVGIAAGYLAHGPIKIALELAKDLLGLVKHL